MAVASLNLDAHSPECRNIPFRDEQCAVTQPRFIARALIALIALTAAGCTTSAGAIPRAGTVVVTPATSTADEPVSVRLSRLPATSNVQVTLSSTDDHKVQWRSAATFRTDGRGALDLNSAPALAGSYTGVDGMGLFWSMQPSSSAAAAGADAYYWPLGASAFELLAKARGHIVGRTDFRRGLTSGPLRYRDLTIAKAGFVGTYVWPAGVSRHRPAVLLFGGSEGGHPGFLSVDALVSRGYPVLALTYFRAPGLPQSLSQVPLEYFGRALSWLSRQPEVDPHRIMVQGVSRGSEAALLLGVHYPNLVHAVVAGVPSNVALCSYPGCATGAWTWQGKLVPFTHQFDEPKPSDDAGAVIPVEQIHGPVLLDCGGRDDTWTSCDFAHAIIARLRAHHHPYGDVLAEFPDAGHGSGRFFPYEPIADHSASTFVQDQRAAERAWPALLAFLARSTA